MFHISLSSYVCLCKKCISPCCQIKELFKFNSIFGRLEHSGAAAHGDTFQPCVLSAREAWKRAKIEEDAAVQAEAKTLAKWDKAVKRLLGATSFFQFSVSRHPGASASSY